MTNLRPSVFVKAAKMVTTSKRLHLLFCCNAISEVGGVMERAFFIDSFKPDETRIDGSWWNSNSDKDRLPRSIALLLCAEMVRDLGKI